MRGGFSFKGIDIANLSLYYAPETEDTFVYRPTSTQVHEENFEGHTGGYFYGVSKEPKEFVLRCYFENSHINNGILEKIHWLFRKGTSGKLVFEKRPWCYYYATVTEVDDTGITNYLNGIITVTMKAYYPFARSDNLYYQPNERDYFNVLNTTAFLDDTAVLPSTDLVTEEPITNRRSFLLYNPGTEYADVGIEIAGEAAEGVTIVNHTTNQECKFIALTDEITTDVNRWIYYDGINGKTILKSEEESVINSLYHDYGFISLAPAFPIKRDVYVYRINNETISIVKPLYDENTETAEYANFLYAGRYIWLSGKWRKIDRVEDSHTIIITESISSNRVQKTIIVPMNELEIYPTVEMSISRLKFIYKPTFA